MKPNSRLLQTAREVAVALFRATWNHNQKEAENAAQCLLQMAVHVTSLVEGSALAHPDAFREVSKDYSFFPILLASGSGRDVKQKLLRVENLPVGENLPFKRLRGPARNDDLREWIENRYNDIQRRRRGGPGADVCTELAAEVRRLPDLGKRSARAWAAVMARDALGNMGGLELLGLLGVNTAKETAKKKRRKENRLRAAYGGTRLVEERAMSGGSTRFFAATGNATHGRELNAIEATKLIHRRTTMLNTPRTDADDVNACTDAIEKRLQSILK